jgi:hypothetical protein
MASNVKTRRGSYGGPVDGGVLAPCGVVRRYQRHGGTHRSEYTTPKAGRTMSSLGNRVTVNHF